MLIYIIHGILAVTAYFACAILFATDRGFISPVFLPLTWAFFCIPALLCGWYLHSQSYNFSGIITFLIAGGLGMLKAKMGGKK